MLRFQKGAVKEVIENRHLGEIPEDEQHWALYKDGIKGRYHVDNQYMKNLSDKNRPVHLQTFFELIRWIEDHMSNNKDRQDVELTVLEMMKEVASRDPAEGGA